MSADNQILGCPKVYTMDDGRVAIEQSRETVVILSPDHILKVIEDLRVCYDYCAAWKDTAQR